MGSYINDWSTLVKGGGIERLITSPCRVFQRLGRILRNNKNYKLLRTMDQKSTYIVDIASRKRVTKKASSVTFMVREIFEIEIIVPLEVDLGFAASKVIKIMTKKGSSRIEILLRNQGISFPSIEARKYIKVIEGIIDLVKASPLEIRTLQIREVGNNVNLNIEINIPGWNSPGISKIWLNRYREYPIYEINTLELPKKELKELKKSLKEYLFKHPI